MFGHIHQQGCQCFGCYARERQAAERFDRIEAVMAERRKAYRAAKPIHVIIDRDPGDEA